MKGCDVVVNFAAESHVDRSILDATNFINTNILGTHNVLASCLDVGVKTVINVSTDEVYGSTLTGESNEESTLLPNSPYAASKASADLISRSFAITHKLDVRTTRSCNNYGKYQFPEKFIPVVIRSLHSGNKVHISIAIK
jgi:dTDP-glucose 4,6-dehydratase